MLDPRGAVVGLVLLELRGAVVLDGALVSREGEVPVDRTVGWERPVSRNAVRSAAKFDFYTVADAALW